MADSRRLPRRSAAGNRPSVLQLFYQSDIQVRRQVDQMFTIHQALLLAQSNRNSRHLWRHLHIQQGKLSYVHFIMFYGFHDREPNKIHCLNVHEKIFDTTSP